MSYLEKISIYVPDYVNMILTKDAQLFEVFKTGTKEINKNRFLSLLMVLLMVSTLISIRLLMVILLLLSIFLSLIKVLWLRQLSRMVVYILVQVFQLLLTRHSLLVLIVNSSSTLLFTPSVTVSGYLSRIIFTTSQQML